MNNADQGFYINDFCTCKCGEKVSPSQVEDISQIIFDDNRNKVIGFECWVCDNWISFPKTDALLKQLEATEIN